MNEYPNGWKFHPRTRIATASRLLGSLHAALELTWPTGSYAIHKFCGDACPTCDLGRQLEVVIAATERIIHEAAVEMAEHQTEPAPDTERPPP